MITYQLRPLTILALLVILSLVPLFPHSSVYAANVIQCGPNPCNGTSGDDKITGDGRNNFIIGESGNDKISGKDGSDILHGGSGDDHLSGGDGADTLEGGLGADSFKCGKGFDTVIDFNANEGDTAASGCEII